ncbi:unnamed protein product [Durusdinium trenchii]|uniref:RNA-editing substrate-binding complex 6 protein domain-containing protein n=1 Tax=Durusdinium trenchii TaxID=1381693 RepID=A0ABP0HN07_9DINO
MASFYPKKQEGPLDPGRVAASLRQAVSRQENLRDRAPRGPPTPGQLLHRALIAKENSSEDVLRIAEENMNELDANSCATAIHKVAQLCRRKSAAAVGRDPRLQKLITLAVPLTGSWSSRQLCHVAWSMAAISMGSRSKQLLDPVCEAFTTKAWEGVPQDLSTFAWSLAALLVESPAFDVAMRVSMERLGEFGVQDLAISAWSVTKLLHPDRRPLLTAIAKESTQKLKDFGGRNISSLSWAYATAQHRDLPLFEALTSECAARIGELGAQELPITLWALAVSGYPSDSVFQAASQQAADCVGAMDVSHICNIVWAVARAGPRDEPLFSALADAVIRRVSELEPLHVANLCWAFANVARADEINDLRKPGMRHVSLFQSLGRRVSRLAGELLPQHHASILWAFASCEVKDGVSALIDHMFPAMQARPGSYDGRQAAGMLWSLAVLREPHQPLMDFLIHEVCHTGTEGLIRDGPAHLASIVWATARFSKPNPLVAQALSAAPRRLAAELAGGAAELSEGRRQNIAAVVRSMYELGLSSTARTLLDELEALGLLSPGIEAWAAWLWGAFAVQDLQLEVRAWAGLSESCEGSARSFALNAAAARAVAAGSLPLARWALDLLEEEGESDAISNLLRPKVGLGLLRHLRASSRGEYSQELSLVLRLCQEPRARLSEDDELLRHGAGARGAALDAAVMATVRKRVVLELGSGLGAATLRVAKALESAHVRLWHSSRSSVARSIQSAWQLPFVGEKLSRAPSLRVFRWTSVLAEQNSSCHN